MSLNFNTGSTRGGNGGGGSSGVVSLIAFNSEPSTPYIPGSKWYYNSKIYTALNSTTKDSGETPSYTTDYLFNGVYYHWNGTDLTAIDESNIMHLTGTETATGDKKFDGKLEAKTVSLSDVSRQVVTTEWFDKKTKGESTKIGVRIYYGNTATVRLGGAVGKTFSPSSDTVRGVDDFADHPVFEKIDCIARYNSDTGENEIFVKGSWEYNALKNVPGYDRFLAKKIFWYKVVITDDYIEIWLSATAETGYTPAFTDKDGNIVGWKYYGKYEVCQAEGAADNGCCVRKNCVPLTNKQNQQYETLLRAKGQRLENLEEITARQLLGIVKYASLDWQASVGQGITTGWQDSKKVAVASGSAETPVRYIIVKASEIPATFYQDIEHNVIYLSNYTEGFKLEKPEGEGRDYVEDYTVEEDPTEYKKINIAGNVATTTSVTVYYGLKLSGGAEDILGDDGYQTANGDITTAARRPVMSLGICEPWGNEHKAVGGAMNRVHTVDDTHIATIMNNPDPNRNDYAYPDDNNDKQWEEIGNIGTANGNNLKFVPSANLAKIAFLPSGNSGNKTNDYAYLTATNGRYSVWYGGSCANGGYCGGFYWACDISLSNSYRYRGARCVLK